MIELVSTLTCPQCGSVSKETMRSDACQFFYDCRHCGAVLRPLKGDCCVFCSYGDVPCPPIQEAGKRGTQGKCCPIKQEAGIQASVVRPPEERQHD